ncbi:TonB-dependent receptor [uncultured Flavobacterium sp.]|uniref:TonB-dependent receptor n=1 Tax=uncultured Flavobacterium sp. TaxID=165435 RepID=UPI0025D5A55B|nr:TonB-dependent receptor [uncultured Flavobacterium sp.]
MRIALVLTTLLFTVLAFAQEKGTIKGVLTDLDLNNETLPFASVAIKGTALSVNTDENGAYSIEVPAGSFTVVFGFLGYETVEVQASIKPGETKVINAALKSTSVQLQDVVIEKVVSREKETALLIEQKNAVEIKQSIGAQEMSRKGVSNVEGGVTKISGVSKVADRGIFVRGLDDRYNYLQINGLNFVPSDPNLKTIPLSFISTDVVRNIDVYKTFSTGLYQDFAGASINILTKDISANPYTKVSITAGMNTNTTLKEFKMSDDGTMDFFGYGAGNRDLPGVFGEGKALGYQAKPSESRDMFGSSWTPSRKKAPLNTGLSITNSDSFTLEGDRRLGYIFNFNFSNSFSAQTGERRNLNSSGTAFKDFDLSNYKYLTQNTFLGSINYRKAEKYNLFFNLIYIQNSENTTEELVGENTDFITIDRPFFLRDMKYIQNTSIGLQQYGTFYFRDEKHTLDYGIAGTIGKNDMPDRKILIAEGTGADASYVTFNGADPFRYYSMLDNFNVNGKLEYQIDFGQGTADGRSANVLRAGVNSDVTQFKFFNRTIRVNGSANLEDTTLNTDNPQQFFDANFDNGNLFYVSYADATYKNEISQFTNAAFLNYTRNWESLVLDLGVRAEYQFRETKYRPESSSVNSPFLTKEYTPFDISPVLNLKYLLNDRTNVRFTASKTSTKPRVREILPFRYQDGDGNFTIGNPDIENTQNYNVDLKYEYFPQQKGVLAVAVFGKHIKNPISRLLEGTSTGFLTKYDNFDEANIFGVEFEAALNLDLLMGDSPVAKRTSFGLNAILMKSDEKADPEKFPRLTSTSRSLQGASDFIINTDIAYEIVANEKVNSKVSFIYNTFSDRIYAVGTDGASDIIQKPIHQLDFTWRNTFNSKYQLNLSMRNLLDSEFLSTQDPTSPVANPSQFSNVNNSLTQGINISLEFAYTF